MQRWIAIALDELTTRPRLLWLSGGAGLLALLIERLVPILGPLAGLQRGVLGLSVSLAFGLASAVVLGAGALDAGQRSAGLPLLLAQPVSAAAVWWGKIAGLSLLALVAQALSFVPTLLLNARDLRSDSALALWTGAAAALPFATATANLVVLALRTRWRVPVVAALAAIAVLVYFAVRSLVRLEENRAVFLAFGILGGGLLVSTFLGGWVWIARARLDRRAGGSALQRTVLISLGAAALPVGLLAAAISTSTVRGLLAEGIVGEVFSNHGLFYAAPDTSGLLGWARRDEYRLIYWQEEASNSLSAAALPEMSLEALPFSTPCIGQQGCAIAVSEDLALWPVRTRDAGWCLVARGSATTEHAGELRALLAGELCVFDQPRELLVSPKLDHVAIITGAPIANRLAVLSTDTGYSVTFDAPAAGETSNGRPYWSKPSHFWEPSGALRVSQVVQTLSGDALRLLRIDPDSGQVEEIGRRALPPVGPPTYRLDWQLRIRTSADGRFVFAQTSKWLEVLDSETGELLQHLEPEGAFIDADTLRDGVLYREGLPGRMRIGYLRPFDGAPATTWELGSHAERVAESEPGRLLVRLDPSVHEAGGELAHPSYVVLDLESGEMLEPPSWLRGDEAPYLGALYSPTPQASSSFEATSPSVARLIPVRSRYAAPAELLWVDLESGETRSFLR